MVQAASTRTRRYLTGGAILLLIVGAVAAVRLWARERSEQAFRDGLAAAKAGDRETLAAAIESLHDSSDFKPHAHLLRGALLVHRAEPAAALEELEAVGDTPELQFERRLLGTDCLLGLGRRGQAEIALRKLAFDYPDQPEPHSRLAALYHDRGAMGAAKQELEAWIRIEPENFLPHRRLALLYHRDLAHNDRAIESYRKALVRNPPQEQEQEIREELAEALILRRDYQVAYDILHQARPTAKVLALQAECCWSLNRRDEARTYLENALALNPEERFALMFAARMHMDEGHPQAALAPLQRALKRDPHDFPCRYRLVRAYRQLGDSEAAEAELERMNRSKRLRTKLTKLYVEAIKHPNSADIREQIAQLCDELGKQKLAAHWRRAADACRQAISAGQARMPPMP